MSTHSSSILHASSQIFPTTTPSCASTTVVTDSSVKPHIPNSLSLNHNHNHNNTMNNNNQHKLSSSSSSSLSRVASSTNASPLPKIAYDTDTKLIDADMMNNHMFHPSNSFFINGHTGKHAVERTFEVNLLITNVNDAFQLTYLLFFFFFFFSYLLLLLCSSICFLFTQSR
jgi:hypothetical protein